MLLPGEHYDVVLTVPGVYDYYCIPHVAHGMVGRIVVGTPKDAKWKEEDYYRSTRAAQTPGTFPEVETLLANSPRSVAG